MCAFKRVHVRACACVITICSLRACTHILCQEVLSVCSGKVSARMVQHAWMIFKASSYRGTSIPLLAVLHACTAVLDHQSAQHTHTHTTANPYFKPALQLVPRAVHDAHPGFNGGSRLPRVGRCEGFQEEGRGGERAGSSSCVHSVWRPLLAACRGVDVRAVPHSSCGWVLLQDEDLLSLALQCVVVLRSGLNPIPRFGGRHAI